MNGVIFLGVDINFGCFIDRDDYELGSIKLDLDGRNYILDVINSFINDGIDEEHSIISCEVSKDLEVFPIDDENNYQLTADDLLSDNIKGSMYIGDDYDIVPESIILFLNVRGTLREINLIVE